MFLTYSIDGEVGLAGVPRPQPTRLHVVPWQCVGFLPPNAGLDCWVCLLGVGPWTNLPQREGDCLHQAAGWLVL